MTTATMEPPASKALTPAQKQLANVRQLMERSEQQLLTALPKHIKPAYFMRVALTTLQRNPKLLECDPTSFLGALFQCAELGLVPDGFRGQAYLVPFKNNKRTPPRMEVQFIPGYRGIIDLVRRSGELSTIDADVVYEKDKFTYTRGFQPTFEHVPYDGLVEDPGKVTHAYAWFRLKDGSYQLKVMTRREVDKIRKRSQAANAGPWVTDFEWMAKKTVLKQLCKLAPTSVEVHTALALDDRADINIPQDLALLADPTQEPTIVDDDDENVGEIIEGVSMPERASTANGNTDSPPAAAATLPDGADRILSVEAQGTADKPFVIGKTERGIEFYSYAKNAAAMEGQIVALTFAAPDLNWKGRRQLVTVQPFGK